jgi:hypothetical protein
MIDRKVTTHILLVENVTISFIFQTGRIRKNLNHLVAEATLFDFILLSYTVMHGVGASTIAVHYIFLGFAFWMSLEVD